MVYTEEQPFACSVEMDWDGVRGQAGSWVHRPRGGEWCRAGRKWQAEPRSPPEGPGDQPGCLSFRFLQQICERDLSQDSRGPRPEGAAGALARGWADGAAGVSPALRSLSPPSAAFLTLRCSLGIVTPTCPLSSHWKRVPWSVPLPRTYHLPHICSQSP